MSYNERNTTVSLVISCAILLYFALRIFFMLQDGNFVEQQIFRLWGTLIGVTIVTNIAGSIIASIAYGIAYKIRYPDDEPEFTEDERDALIDLKGTRVAYIIFSLCVLGAMLTFVFGRPPLVMFTLIFTGGMIAEILSDVWKLYRYRRGV